MARDQVLPSVLQKWAGVSLDTFIRGLDPAMIDGLLESDILSAEQKKQLSQARAQMLARPKSAESTASNSNGKAAVA